MEPLVQAIYTFNYAFWSFLLTFVETIPICKELTDLKDKILAFIISDITGIPVWLIILIMSIIGIIGFVISLIAKSNKRND